MFAEPKKSAAAGMFFGSSAAAMLAASRSFLLGLIDLVYNLYRRFIAQPRRNRWFSAGYGDLPSYYYAVDHAMDEWKRDGLKRYLSKPLRVTWRKIDSGAPAVLCDEGFFVSPLSRYIGVPDAVKMARFLFVRAAPGGPLPPTRSIVVHTAATGVSTYAERDAEMARPLLAHGIASCILMAPYNGTRAPEDQRKHYIDNVADYMKQSLAIILEGVALLRWLDKGFAVDGRSEHPAHLKLGAVGLSWGGAMASCIALTSKLPVACMAGLGSDSPRVMATGAINWQIDWAALQQGGSHAEAQRELVAIFTRLTFAHLLEYAEKPTIGSVVQVSAENDHYVFASEGAQLHESLRRAVVPGKRAELRWIEGGHGSAFLRCREIFVPAVVEAVEAL